MDHVQALLRAEAATAPLFTTTCALLKGVNGGFDLEDPDYIPRVAGIASSESPDAEGDTILRKMLNVDYIKAHGFINWDHSRAPGDQLGYITRVDLVDADGLGEYEDLLQTSLAKTSSLYVEGVLYRHMPRAIEVHNLLKSIPVGSSGALGMSVDGTQLRSAEGIVMANIQGVAITPAPAHTETLCRLLKSLGSVGLELSTEVGGLGPPGLTEAEAVVRLMELRPCFSLDLAKKLVRFFINKRSQGV